MISDSFLEPITDNCLFQELKTNKGLLIKKDCPVEEMHRPKQERYPLHRKPRPLLPQHVDKVGQETGTVIHEDVKFVQEDVKRSVLRKF